MRRPLFDFVEQIRKSDKYFDVSRLELQRALLVSGKCDIRTEHDVVDEKGETITTELRLNLHARDEMPQSWTMSLKLHGIRIDGLDHEAKFKTGDGNTGRGWHRHQWDADEESAERRKVEVRDLDDVVTREEFLIRGLSVLKVRLNALDHGQFSLLSD